AGASRAGDGTCTLASGPAGDDDQARRNLREARGAHLRHHDLELAGQDVEHAFDARLTERAEAPQIRPADADRVGADRERLEDIRAAAKTAVYENRHAALHGRHDFLKRFDARDAARLGPAAVIRHDEPIHAALE